MSTFLGLVVSGAVSGGIYAIMASGLVLSYEASGIFNFAQGAIAFATAFVFFQLNTGQGWPIGWAAVVSVLVFAPLLGFLLDLILLRRLATAPVHARIVGTIGLLVALPNLVLFVAEQINLRGGTLPSTTGLGTVPGLGPVPSTTWTLMKGVVVNSDQVIIFGVAALAALGLWVLLRRTRLGLQMRADVDKRELAGLRGIDSGRVSAISWVLTTLLAGLAGVLLGPFIGLDDITYTFFVLGCLAAVVFAGFRSLPLAFAGGLLLGIIQNLVAGYADDFLPSFIAAVSGLRTAVPFFLTLVGLFVLARRRGRAGGTAASEAPQPDHREGLPQWRRWLPWIITIVALVIYVQFIADEFWSGLVLQGVVIGVVFLSFVVVTGIGGMVSLMQATFVTVGGFAAGWLVKHQFSSNTPVLMDNRHLNFFVAAILATLLASLVGGLIAVPIRRLGALAFALGTLSIAFAADLLIFQIDSIRNGSLGYLMNSPKLFGFEFTSNQSLTMMALVVFGIVTWVIHNLEVSATGRAVFAARSSDVAARTTGLSPDRAKVTVFAISAGIAGLGGALYAVTNSPFTNTSAPAFVGLFWLAVVVTWGVRRPAGALLAGLTFAVGSAFFAKITDWNGVLHDIVSSTYFLPILFGLGAINLAKNPDGILALSAEQRADKKRKREAKRAAAAAIAAAEADSGTVAPARAAAGVRAVTPGAGAGNEALRLDDVRAGYGEIEVLHGVDLTLASGGALAILGPNGAGKSTLCKAIAGQIMLREGAVHLGDRDLSRAATHSRAQAGLLVIPESRGIFPSLTVEENLQIRLTEPSELEAAYAHFPILKERRKGSAGLLSGGEQQLLALAPALVRPPAVLVADEPTLGLSPMATEAVYETLGEVRARGCAVLLVEERATHALAFADTVAVMSLGRITWAGTRDEVDSERLASAYLGGGGNLEPTGNEAASTSVPGPAPAAPEGN
ncbi:MAG: ABC-type branched-chain amino acid transport system, ATPase component [Actinomycetia bacterium]|nr:ABC-type branched-chain amino acid transport system, ATPase component [Actinomycetes bacterium]